MAALNSIHHAEYCSYVRACAQQGRARCMTALEFHRVIVVGLGPDMTAANWIPTESALQAIED